MDLGQFWDTYNPHLQKLAIYGLGIAGFALLVAILYVPMGHRLMFGRRKGEEVSTEGRKLVYVLLFPLVSFGFFLVMVASMLFLTNVAGSASALEPEDILTISMGIVLAIRITAYFHEGAAEEVGKIMPLGLLGVFLVTNPNLDNLSGQFKQVQQIFANMDLVVLYFVVIVLAEFWLRALYALFTMGAKKPKPTAARPNKPAPPPVRPK